MQGKRFKGVLIVDEAPFFRKYTVNYSRESAIQTPFESQVRIIGRPELLHSGETTGVVERASHSTFRKIENLGARSTLEADESIKQLPKCNITAQFAVTLH